MTILERLSLLLSAQKMPAAPAMMPNDKCEAPLILRDAQCPIPHALAITIICMHVILDTIDREREERSGPGKIFGSAVGQPFIDPRIRYDV